MFVGHLAVGFAAKRFAPKTSLGTLLLASQFADVLWPVLLLADVEHARIAPGITKASALHFYDYSVTHSLSMGFAWGFLFALVYYALKKYRTGAVTVFIGVVSHWFLDFLVHRPDLPLRPDSPEKFGLGLWNSIGATIAVEGTIFAIGLWMYLSSTRARDRAGRMGFWVMVLLLLLLWIPSLSGTAPPSMNAVATTGIVGALLILMWGYWIERHRPAISEHA
jgi:membrane-bound metal-dependent hydrolase YbcI (DUF457 family)